MEHEIRWNMLQPGLEPFVSSAVAAARANKRNCSIMGKEEIFYGFQIYMNCTPEKRGSASAFTEIRFIVACPI